MRRVKQDDDNGCGIACVAMLAQLTYQDAKARMPPKCSVKGTTGEELRRGLGIFGIQSVKLERIKMDQNYKKFEFHAVLRGRLTRTNEDHWVVWDAKRRMRLDPWKQGAPFKCKSFVRILSGVNGV